MQVFILNKEEKKRGVGRCKKIEGKIFGRFVSLFTLATIIAMDA